MARPKVFQVPAVVEGVSPLKDGGMSLRFHTQEIKERDKVKLMGFYQQFGYLQFSNTPVKNIPKDTPIREAGAKTPSQRMRAVMFVYWKQHHSDIDFDVWYAQRVEQIINKYKEQLS